MPEKKKSFFSRFSKKKDDEIAVLENIADAEAPEEEKPAETWSEAGYTDAETAEAQKAKEEAEEAARKAKEEEEAAQAAQSEEEAPDISVPDIGEDEPFVPKFVSMKKVKKLTLKQLYLLAGGIAVIIISLVAITVIISMSRKSPYPEGSVALTLPNYDNLAAIDYMFMTKELKINGFDAKLQGVMLDSASSVFYFNRFFNAGYMDFRIEDSQGNTYYMDLSRHLNSERTDTLYFEPLKEGIESFELILPDYIDTGYDNTVFYLDKPLSYKHALYSGGQSAVLDFDGHKAVIKIDEAVFSTSGTFINYSMSPSSGGIQLLPENTAAPLRLTEERSIVPSIPEFTLHNTIGGNTIMGRVGFWPPGSFNGEATITVNNLKCLIQMDKTIATNNLFLNDPARAITLSLADYRLVLERMGKRANVYVLVLHTEDTKLPLTDDYSNRVAANYDIELIGYDKNGAEVALKPISHIFEKGSDFIFVDEGNRIVFESPDDVSLRLNTAEVKVSSLSFSLDLNALSDERNLSAARAVSAIIADYKNRNKDKQMYTAQLIGYNITDNAISALIYEAGTVDGKNFNAKYIVTGDISNEGIGNISEKEI